VIKLADNENNSIDLQRHSAIQDARISNLETKFEMFMQSVKESNDKRDADLKDFKDEMRDRDNQRHAEILAMNQQNKETRDSIKEIYQTTDAKVSKIESKIDSLSKHIQNMAIAAVVGVGAVVAAVVSIMKP